MPTAAIELYRVILSVHILAVVIAFGVTFTYPLLDAFARRGHIRDLAALHRFQSFLSGRVITPAMVVVLAAGFYLTSDGPYKLSKPWVSAGFGILIVLFGLVGAVFTPTEKKLAALAARELESGSGTPSAEYEALSRRLAMFGMFAYLLIIAAIFVMTTKPGT